VEVTNSIEMAHEQVQWQAIVSTFHISIYVTLNGLILIICSTQHCDLCIWFFLYWGTWRACRLPIWAVSQMCDLHMTC